MFKKTIYFSLLFVFCLALPISSFSYNIQYSFDRPVTGEPNLITDQSGFSFNENFDRYAERVWSVIDTQDDGSGGVDVVYSTKTDGNYSYWSGIYMNFKILPDTNTSEIEPVVLSVSSSYFLSYEWRWDHYANNACCGGDIVLYSASGSPLKHSSRTIIDDGLNIYVSDLQYGSLFDQITLYTNTDYRLTYHTDLYVEALPYTPGDLGFAHFDSWDEYNDFFEITGGSGISSITANGFANYNLQIAPIPESSSIILFGFGLLVIASTRRFLRTML